MNLLRLLLGLCTHENVGWPLYDRQRCLDCAMSREYRFGRERQGKWERDQVERTRQEVWVMEEER